MAGILASDDQLAAMPWDELIKMRAQFTSPDEQMKLAPYEHRAYAREQVAANPLMAPVYGLMTPGYQALKVATGGKGSRTPASMEELKQGLLGTGEGLAQGVRGLLGI